MLFAKVTHPEKGYENDQEYIKRLDFNTMYPVTLISMRQSHTYIEIEGVSGVYNSIQFTFYDGEEEKTLKRLTSIALLPITLILAALVQLIRR